MIKVYGMDTCPDCVEVKKQIKDNKNFDFICVKVQAGHSSSSKN